MRSYTGISTELKQNARLAGYCLAALALIVSGCGSTPEAPQTEVSEGEQTSGADAHAEGAAPQAGPMARFANSLGVGGSRAQPAAPPQPVVFQIPVGTPLRVRTTSTLSTNSAQSGQEFVAHLAEPIVVDGKELAPRGTEVIGRVVNADPGGRVKGVASITLALAKMRVANGEVVNVETSRVIRNARTTKKKDATKIGIGSGTGALIGAIAGGGKGAAVGAAIGGGAGTGVVLSTRGEPAVVSAETLLTFTTRAPMEVRF